MAKRRCMTMSSELFEAIDKQDVTRVSELLKQGADPNVFNTEWPGYTPLQMAVSELEHGASFKMAELLLEYGADINAWDKSNDLTPLLIAIFSQNDKAIGALLAGGADPNVRSGDGDSPLRWLVHEKKYELVELLLHMGARETIDEPGEPGGLTALGLASKQLNAPIVELLLKNGANPHFLDEYISPPQKIMPARKDSDYDLWNTVMKLLKHELDKRN